MGFDLENQPKIFPEIWTGDETRYAPTTDQQLRPYESYEIFRYFENIAPGRNGGGWVDPIAMEYLDRYSEQLWDTILAKAPAINMFEYADLLRIAEPGARSAWQNLPTSFNYFAMLRECCGFPGAPGSKDPLLADVVAYSLGKIDAAADALGSPVGLESYHRNQVFLCRARPLGFNMAPARNLRMSTTSHVRLIPMTPDDRIARIAFICIVSVVAGMSIPCAVAQTEPSAHSLPPPVTFTAEQDQQNMMKQLGIRALRPGPSGNENAPNHANYDESKANPYPNIPDALTLKDGGKVTTASLWEKRRAEIIEGFDCCVYGRVPKSIPKVTWSVAAVDHERVGFTPVIAKEVVGHVDNSGYPLIDVNIRMIVVTPAEATKPVPVLMMFGPAAFPEPNQPSREELEHVNTALKSLLIQQDPSLKKVFEDHPAYELEMPRPFRFPELNADGDPPNTWELASDGWGFALIDPASIQADNGAGLTRGIIGLVNHGQPRTPEDWGALRAWAWGAGRGLDYLETDPAVDAKHVGIEGVSRYGKAALVTMAFDQRFAAVLVGSSGKGGATLLRRNFGEAVESLTGGEYYWMAGNFMKYGASDAVFRSMNASEIPVDSNELIALCAPRLTFISYGIPEKGDAKWLDHRGSFMATLDASPVWPLLGEPGLTPLNHYTPDNMPPVNTGLLGGKLAWRQHDGGHTDAPNMKYFLGWADKFIGRTSAFAAFAQ